MDKLDSQQQAVYEQALQTLQERRARIKALESELKEAKKNGREEVAIIGYSVSLPNHIDDGDRLWALLKNGQALDTGTGFRWEDKLDLQEVDQSTFTPHANLFEDTNKFDANFFNMSAVEAAHIDPHHRMLLELVWRAFENANIPIESVRGRRVGVFIGCGQGDYAGATQQPTLQKHTAYDILGSAPSVAAGRVSYVFDFKGPTVNLDTSCSTGLTALHFAKQSLAMQECDMALVGAANLILSPASMQGFSALNALSPTGQCYTFDDRADGYLRGEGGGVLLLKRATDAKRDNNNVLGIVRGSALSHDGRSNGLSAPNGKAQYSVIKRAMQDADVNVDQLHYIETHGTGTKLGDPIEVESLSNVLDGRQDKLPVGSVKTNIGHLECAAGIASIIKVLLIGKHRVIPPLPFSLEPNQLIDWQLAKVKPIEALTEFDTKSALLMGVSSFGMSGTNAHVILEVSPPHTTRSENQAQTNLLPLSARSVSSLKSTGRQYLAALAEGAKTKTDNHILAAIRQVRDSHKEFRSALIWDAQHCQALTVDFEDYDAKLLSGHPTIGFVIQGQGLFDQGFAKRCIEQYPSVRDNIRKLEMAFTRQFASSPCSLMDLISNGEFAPLLEQTQYAQPAIFAFNYALCMQLQEFGVKADIVAGHSLGEWVALALANALSIEQAFAAVCQRALAMQAAQPGGMLLVFAARDVVASMLSSELCISGENGPEHTVVSGSSGALAQFQTLANNADIKNHWLAVDRAFHSKDMVTAAQQFKAQISHLTANACNIPVISNLDGHAFSHLENPQDYLSQHIVKPVMFCKTFETLCDAGVDLIVEVGSKPFLRAMWSASSCPDIVSLSGNTDGLAFPLDSALAELFNRGVNLRITEPVDNTVSLPGYVWDKSELDDRYVEAVGKHNDEREILWDRQQITSFCQRHNGFPLDTFLSLVVSMLQSTINLTKDQVQLLKMTRVSALKHAAKLRLHFRHHGSQGNSFELSCADNDTSSSKWSPLVVGRIIDN